ncbi:MAG: MFS transporter, partial [Nanoarchaeota archaeon]|nr:MFS transporter [Nanoarchaeota archaeon]
ATRLVLWIPIILTGVLFYMGYPHTIFLFLLFATLFYGFSAISAPAWFSWIGSLVKEDDRGRYFSKRNRAIGFSSIISLILAAFILDYSKKIGIQRGDVLLYTLIGFGILFILAMITRFISFVLLSRQYEPKIKIRKEDECPFLPFLKNSYKNDFGRFTIFKFFLSFAVAIIGPFWIVYMLQNLGFSYFWFISTVISHMLFQIIFLPYLGKFSDKFGNVKLMKISVYFIASIPFLWFLSSLIENQILLKVYLLTIPSIVAGVSWGGYNLATNNYLYDAISQKKRGFELPHVNFMVGIGMFLGAGAGSLIVLLDIAFMEILLFIMILSGVLRLLVLIFGLKYLKEVKNVGDFSSEYVLNELNPIEGHGLEMKGTNLKKHKVEHYI